MLDEIERINTAENEAYGDENLEELGEKSQVTAEKVRKKVDELNRRLWETPADRSLKKAVKTLEEKHLPRLEKYEDQERLLDGRNSYSKTDLDASSLRMKEDRAARKPLARPAYNVQMGTEGQVVGYSVHQPVIRLASFPTYNNRSFHRGESSRMVQGMLAMAAKKTMLSWRKKAWATSSSATLPSETAPTPQARKSGKAAFQVQLFSL